MINDDRDHAGRGNAGPSGSKRCHRNMGNNVARYDRRLPEAERNRLVVAVGIPVPHCHTPLAAARK